MAIHRVTLIEGDGIGPEVTSSAIRCVEASGVDVDWETQPAGEPARRKYKSVLPKSTLESIKTNRVALKGPITTPVGKGFRSVNVALRQELELFANVRPVKTIPGITTPFSNVDLVVIRENTEDLYAGIEYENRSSGGRKLIRFIKQTTGTDLRADTSISIKPISHYATKRIAEYAFGYAQRHSRKKITAVHKANIMKYTDGLFLKVSEAVAKRHRGIAFEDRIVDNMCMQLVQNPEEFDVLLCPNLYGDIISDLCAGLVGGLGVTASGDIGHKCAVFEPVHGSAPKHAGKNKVNPTAAILSAVMMLRHMKENKAADRIEKAVHSVIKEGKHVTYDIARSKPVGTKQMTDAIIKRI